MTKEHFTIRRMKKEELQIAIDWARQEGWNPGLNDADCFYRADPEGFFIGLIDDEPIATGSAIVYDDAFAFCGLYIVKPDYRKQGYGIRLTHERLNYTGNRLTGIDGVVANVAIYRRIGYRSAHKNIRYESTTLFKGGASPPEIIPLNTLSFEEIETFDRRYFPAVRSKFLRNWIAQPESHALGYVNKGLNGYGVIRKCIQGYKIGPLFAESFEIGCKLFEALCSKIKDGPIYLDIPEPNRSALDLVERYCMQPTFEVMRMYRNGIPDIDLNGIYGITTYELG